MPRRFHRRARDVFASARPSGTATGGWWRLVEARPPKVAALALLVVLLGCAPLDRLGAGDEGTTDQTPPSAAAPAASDPTPAASVPAPVPTVPAPVPTVPAPVPTVPAPAAAVPTAPAATFPPPVPATDPAAPNPAPAGAGVAPVEGVEVLLLESFPVQVQVVVTGYLPDPCTSLGPIVQERSGNTITVTIPTVRDPAAICAQVIEPFTETVPLDGEFPAGEYTVSVNGEERAFRV